MKKIILNFAFAGCLMIAASACNSTKNASETTDSTVVDSTMTTPIDSTVVDTSSTTTPDTTAKM